MVLLYTRIGRYCRVQWLNRPDYSSNESKCQRPVAKIHLAAKLNGNGGGYKKPALGPKSWESTRPSIKDGKAVHHQALDAENAKDKDGPVTLVLSPGTKSLVESDFRRAVPGGHHIPGWRSVGDIKEGTQLDSFKIQLLKSISISSISSSFI